MTTDKKFRVQLYNEKNRDVDARLIFSDGSTLDGITVRANQANSFSVYMPRVMGSVWTDERVTWEEALEAVSALYREKYIIRFDFKSIKRFRGAFATVRALDSGSLADKISVSVNIDDTEEMYVKLSRETFNAESKAFVVSVEDEIRQAFLAEAFGDDNRSESGSLEITFDKMEDFCTSFADMHLPGTGYVYRDFFIKRIGQRKDIEVYLPKSIPEWKHKVYSFETIKEAAKSAFSGAYKERFPEEKDDTAGKSSLCFYPHTVLRPVKSAKKDLSTNHRSIAVAMSKGEIGTLETNILVWIERLRYATEKMLSGLVENGRIFAGEGAHITDSALNKALSRMARYSLCDLTHFVALDDMGYEISEQKTRIITLGNYGNTVLHEMNKKTHFNAFDILRDGNTVKRYLCANQWLIYFLNKYRNRIDESFDTEYMLYQRGVDYTGARIFATVEVDSVPFTAEPVRRCEDFEKDADKEWLCEKMSRVIGMYDNLEHLYNDAGEVNFKVRPVICMVCEDDEHVDEVYGKISAVLNAHPEQVVIFTTDLRVFNDMNDEERFFSIKDGDKSFFSVDGYIESNRSIV